MVRTRRATRETGVPAAHLAVPHSRRVAATSNRVPQRPTMLGPFLHAMFLIMRRWTGSLSLLPVLLLGCGCTLHTQDNRGLSEELHSARAEAQVERERVLALELRLAQLEQQASRLEERTEKPAPAPRARDTRLLDRLDALIALNQSLVQELRPRSTPRAASESATPTPVLTATERGSECVPGLTKEERIRLLVRELRGERSPWLEDGLSYEESQALRLLIRRERELDPHNPWQ